MVDFLKKRWSDPAALLTEIVNAHPDDRPKQLRIFEAMVLGSGTLMSACVAYVFDALTQRERAEPNARSF